MRPATPKQKALIEYLGFNSDVSMELAANILSEATSNPNLQEKLDRWHLDKLRLHPQLYAKEVAAAKAGRAEALWSEVNSEYGSSYHPLKRITKGQAADAVRYLDQHHFGWDRNLFQLYGTLNVNVVHDYFFPAIKATHPEAVKVTLSDEIGFGSQRQHVEPQTWRPPVRQPKRSAVRVVTAVLLSVVVGAVIWLIQGVKAPWITVPKVEITQQDQKNSSTTASAQKSLTEMRIWTDSNGRTLQAKLISISKGADGLYVGLFRRPNDDDFTYHIGLLSKQDIELVRTLTQQLKP